MALGEGVLHVAYHRDDVDETNWETVRHSQFLACDQCGRSFEQLTPHNFSFNSPLGWCPACEGLGTQTGANPTALLARCQAELWPTVPLRCGRTSTIPFPNECWRRWQSEQGFRSICPLNN